MSFVENIIASVIAGILVIVIGSVMSNRVRWVLTATLGRLLDIDTEFVFSNRTHAEEDLRRELARTSSIHLYTGRGNDLQGELFAGVLGQRPKARRIEFRVLLPVAMPKTGEPDWTGQRESELASFDPAFGQGVLREQIVTTTKFLASYSSAGEVELGFYSCPHMGRILITDKVVFFTPYHKRKHGRESPIIKYRRGGEMYDFFERLFNQLWEYRLQCPGKDVFPRSTLTEEMR